MMPTHCRQLLLGMEIAQAGKQWKYEMRKKKFLKGMPKTLFNIWVTQQLDSKARHGLDYLQPQIRRN
jgi:hypothetical protein